MQKVKIGVPASREMRKLDFKSPFWKWGGLGFFNCYAAVYMYFQGAPKDIFCSAKEGKGCNDCSNCSDTLNNLFATIQGQWTTRQSWSGEKTKIQKEIDEEFGSSNNASDKLVDFIIGFTGYDYKKIDKGLNENIVASINEGRPVIAKLKDDQLSCVGKGYRIIIGYDADTLLEPDYKPAVDYKGAINYDEIEFLYIFGEKIPQKYTFIDFLKVIEKAMDSDFAEGIWYDFIKKFDYEGEKLWHVNSMEIKKRFTRLQDVMGWLPNIGHGLQTAFRDKKLLDALGADNDQLSELYDVITHQTHLLHNRGYMLSAISDTVNALNIKDSDEWPWDKHGLITATWQILNSIMDCDLKILMAIKKAIHKLT